MSIGYEIWTTRGAFNKQSAADFAEAERIRNDGDLTAEARMVKLREVRGRIQDRHAGAVMAARPKVEAAREEYLQAIPSAAERRAANASNERRQEAVLSRQMAEGASLGDLTDYVADAVGRRSLARAHGLRQAIDRNESLSQEDRTQLLTSLDSIGADSHATALAALVGAQHAMAGLETALALFDPTGETAPDPVAALQAGYAAATVPGPDGSLRHISTLEFNRLLEASGVPPHAPGYTPAELATV